MLIELMPSNLTHAARELLAKKIIQMHYLFYKDVLTVGDMVKIPGPIPQRMMARYSGAALEDAIDSNVYHFVVAKDICGNLHWVDITEYE